MYNAQETLTVEPDREYDEKRQADDQKTKQKMESIRSKLKTDPRKVRLVEQQQASLTGVSAFLSLSRKLIDLHRQANKPSPISFIIIAVRFASTRART